MTLTVIDRILLLSVLPNEGDITTLRVVSDLRVGLSFSEEELVQAEIVSVPEMGQVRWNPAVTLTKDVPIGPKAHALISGALEQLSKEKKLRADLLPLYDRFVGET